MRPVAWFLTGVWLLAAAWSATAAEGAAGGSAQNGYTWNDAPGYDWADIRPGSTPLAPVSQCDDCVLRDVPIGFTFPFFGASYETVSIGANGILQFGNTTNQWGPAAIPNELLPGPAIMPFFSDWDPGGAGDVYAARADWWPAAGGRRAFVVQWQGIENWDCDRGGTATWEVILIDDGRIVFQYKDADISDTYRDKGRDMTVGLQRDSLPQPGCFVQYSNEQAVITSGMAITWQPHPGPCGLAAATATPPPPSPTPAAGKPTEPLAVLTPASTETTPSPAATSDASGAPPPSSEPVGETAGGTSIPRAAPTTAQVPKTPAATPAATTPPAIVTSAPRPQGHALGTGKEGSARSVQQDDGDRGVAAPTVAAVILAGLAAAAAGAAGFLWLRERRSADSVK